MSTVLSGASSERQVLTVSRTWILLAGGACLLAAVLGVWFIGQSDDAVLTGWSWIGVGVLGVAVALALVQLRRPTQLVLTPDGFSMTGLVGTGPVPWHDVDAFFIYEEPMTEDGGVPAHVAWRLKSGAAAADGLAARLNRSGGLPIDGSMPRNLGLSPQALLALLEDWRGRYGRP